MNAARATTGGTMLPGNAAIRRVSWGAIFAGTVVAMALMVFFTTLGLAIGAAAVDPLYESDPLSGMATGSGIYFIATQLIALAVGGFRGSLVSRARWPLSSTASQSGRWRRFSWPGRRSPAAVLFSVPPPR